jgi:hypothetical protein
MGQIVHLLHGRQPTPAKRRVKLTAPFPHQQDLGAIGDDLAGFIWRWVRGFHAALYRQFLPLNTDRRILGPLPAGVVKDGRPFSFDDPGMFRASVATLKNNYAGGNVDQVVNRNGKCIYHCVWDTARHSQKGAVLMCHFRLRVYDWERLARGSPAKFAGCAGSYLPTEPPVSCARATSIVIPGANTEPLVAFGR